MQYLRHTYTKELFVVYLILTFNRVSCILSSNPTLCITYLLENTFTYLLAF